MKFFNQHSFSAIKPKYGVRRWVIAVMVLCLGFMVLAAGHEVADAVKAKKPAPPVNAKRQGAGKTSNKKCTYRISCVLLYSSGEYSYQVVQTITTKRLCSNGTNSQYWGKTPNGCSQGYVDAWVREGLSPTTLVGAAYPGCGNTHAWSAILLPRNGECGTANGVETNLAPAADTLCKKGVATVVAEDSTTYKWDCEGTGGGAGATCLAPKPNDFGLMCEYTPDAESITNEDSVVFTAIPNGIAGNISYIWSGAITGSGRIYTASPQVATDVPQQVFVKATIGQFESNAVCSPYKVKCSPSLPQYCPDAKVCIPAGDTCPVSACGPGFAISSGNTNYLVSGRTLSITTPGDPESYNNANSLCGPGNLLITDAGKWNFLAGPGRWVWDCKHPDAVNAVTCTAECAEDLSFCPESGTCSLGCKDWCPNIAGTQTDRTKYCIDNGGDCVNCNLTIKYFRLKPTDIRKDDPDARCNAYWESYFGEVDPDENTSVNECLIDGQPVPLNMIYEGSQGFPLTGGKHTLLCKTRSTQEVEILDEEGEVIATETKETYAGSSEAEVNCRYIPAVKED